MFVQLEQRRRSHFPWVTLLLVLLCVSCFVALSVALPEQRMQWVAHWGLVPARLFDNDGWSFHFARLVTALFIHADWLHLVGNLLFLVIFGLPTERPLGRGLFLLLFLLGGALANLIGAVTVSQAHIAIVGCSGAVSAVVGAYLALFPRASLGLVLPLGLYFEFVRVPALLLIGLWVMLQLLFTWAGPTFGAVVWWTHIAGFMFGMLFAVLVRPALARRQRR